jgi:hypothetical protein
MMLILRILFAAAFACLTGMQCLPARAEETNSPLTKTSPVIVDYFFESGCPDCSKVKNLILPELKERFEGFHVLNSYDIGVKSNVIRLVTYQEKLNIVSNMPVMMVVDYRHVLNGFDAIKAGLSKQVDECISERQDPGWQAPGPIAVSFTGGGSDIAARRMEKFTLSMVIAGGFLDGINHCAISTIVFFMTLLAVSKVRGREFLLMGIPFCLASFLTYLAIGFGLLRAIHALSGFMLFRTVVNMAVVVVLGVFAVFSFLDAYKFKVSGNPDDVAFQLPRSIKMRIHAVMREGIGSKSLVLGGLVVGTVITALEGVCTGQVLIPTLVMVAQSGHDAEKAYFYLVVYNLVSDIPLIAVMVLTYFGLRTQTLLDWSKKNVVVSKVMLGVFFLVLAVLVLRL